MYAYGGSQRRGEEAVPARTAGQPAGNPGAAPVPFERQFTFSTVSENARLEE